MAENQVYTWYLQFDCVHLICVLCFYNLLQSLWWFFVSLQAYLSLAILGWWRYSSKSSDFFQVWWKKFVILHHPSSRYQFLSSATNLVSDTDSPYSPFSACHWIESSLAPHNNKLGRTLLMEDISSSNSFFRTSW